MSTVDSVLNGMRYDLRNYGDIDFDQDMMLHYLNRALDILEYKMASFNSDAMFTQADVTLSDGDNYVSCPTRCLTVREVWIDEDRKTELSHSELYYRRQFRDTDESEPNYWSHIGDQIQFEVEAADDYTVTVMYDMYAADLASGADMPYNGFYDHALREVAVQMCYNKEKKNISKPDSVWGSTFDQILVMDIVNRKFVRKEYKLDF